MLDLSKLTNVKPGPNGCTIARCPVCEKNGHDRKGTHLRIFPNGAYGCAANQKDEDHLRQIWELAGDGSIGTIEREDLTLKEPLDVVETFFEESLLGKLIKKHDYFVNRGLTGETLSFFRGGLALDTGKLKNRYVIPIYNDKGKINGFTGRYIYPIDSESSIPKWKHVGNKNKFTWPFFFNKKHILEKGYVILVESPGCVLKLWDCDIKNSICLFGTTVNPSLIMLLISLGVKVIIATNNEPDNNSIGNKAAQKIRLVLENYFDSKNIFVFLPPEKDFLDCKCEQIEIYKVELEEKI